MFPKLLNSSDVTLAVLNNVNASSIVQTSEGKYTYDIEIKKDGKDLKVVKGTKLLVNDQKFNIVRKTNTIKSDGEQSVSISCEHTSYDANNYTFDTFAFTGTVEEILAEMISVTGADFTIGTIASTGTLVFTRNETTTLMYAVKLLAGSAMLEVEYDNKIINMPTQIGSNNGVRFQAGRNLSGIVYDEDYLEDTVSISVDVVEVSKTEEFKTGKIKLPDNVSLGDVVGVYTDEISETTRVVQIKYDPIEGKNQGYVLSTEIDTFTKNNTNQKFSMFLKGRPVYGVDINNEDGMEIERSDLLARVRLNADELRFQTGNGLGGYTDAIYFDILSGKYKFVGDIDATGTITGADFIGGTIDIGSGTFTVDILGNVIANSLTIGGGSGIANLSDAGALAVKDAVDLLIAGEVLNAGDVATLDIITETYIGNNSISTAKLQANSVTANEISVSQLSAISANIGTITAGTISGVEYNTIGGSTDKIRIGETGFAQDIQWVDSGGATNAVIQGVASTGDILVSGDRFTDLYAGTDITLTALDDVRVFANDRFEIFAANGYLNGSEIITTAGTGLDKSVNTLSVDLTEVSNAVISRTTGTRVTDVDIVYSSFGITIRSALGSLTLPWD